MQPLRTAWPADFPPVFIAAGESVVKRHPDYAAAKAGNAEAAARLVSELVTADIVDAIGATLDCRDAIVASIHAVEAGGVNAIPEAVADRIAQQLGLETDENLVQINVVNHTGADGFARLARQALFDGKVRERHRYLIVDDFVGQGGTIANFRGWIESAPAPRSSVRWH